MNLWKDPKKDRPQQNEVVDILLKILYRKKGEALFINGRYLRRGEDITKYVVKWKSKIEKEILT